MSRTCDGGACVVVVPYGEHVYVFTTLHPDWGVIKFTQPEWHERVTAAQTDGFDVERFFAGKRGFNRILAPAEITQFGTDVTAGKYDFITLPV